MSKLWKRNAVVGAVLALVLAAIALNGRYAADVEESSRVLGQATEVSAPEQEQAAAASVQTPPDEAEEAPAAESPAADYFAAARLSRQQARDSAMAMLQEAGKGEEMDERVAGEVAQGIEALAGNAIAEAQIENMVTAKGYDDCVAFLSDDSASIVVSTRTDGLQTEDIARIIDIVKQETGLSASAIKILEVS